MMRNLLGVLISACVMTLTLAGCDGESETAGNNAEMVFPPKGTVIFDRTENIHPIFSLPEGAEKAFVNGEPLIQDMSTSLFYAASPVAIDQPIILTWPSASDSGTAAFSVTQSTWLSSVPSLDIVGEPVDIVYSVRDRGLYVLTTASLYFWSEQLQTLSTVAEVSCNIMCQLVLDDSELTAYIVVPNVYDSKLISVKLPTHERGVIVTKPLMGSAVSEFSRMQDAKWVDGNIVTAFHLSNDSAFNAQVINPETGSLAPFLNEELKNTASLREFQGLDYDPVKKVGILYSPKFSELIAWSAADGKQRVLGVTALDDIFMRDDGEDNSRFYWDVTHKRFYATNRSFSVMIAVDATELMRELSLYDDVSKEVPSFNVFATRRAERLMTSNDWAVGFPSDPLRFGYARSGVADAAIDFDHQIAYRIYDGNLIAINLIAGDKASIARFNIKR